MAAQEEYLTAKRISAQSTARSLSGLDEGARQRMRLAGMSDAQIAAVEATGKVQTRVTITAPIAGVVGELNAREGMTVMAGAPLFRLNGLSTVWVNAELPESLAAQVRPGNPVEARTPALPGVVFNGQGECHRSGSQRRDANDQGAHRIGQSRRPARPRHVRHRQFHTAGAQGSAAGPVRSGHPDRQTQRGRRQRKAEGRFASVDVELGLESNGQTEIRKGLQAGQKVVVSGQFLVDSEANLKAAASRMDAMPASKP